MLLTGVLFGQLGAAEQARKLYYELIGTAEFGSTVVHDRSYVSARWPGDAYLFARTVRDLLESERSLYRTDLVTRSLSRACDASRSPLWLGGPR